MGKVEKWTTLEISAVSSKAASGGLCQEETSKSTDRKTKFGLIITKSIKFQKKNP